MERNNSEINTDRHVYTVHTYPLADDGMKYREIAYRTGDSMLT